MLDPLDSKPALGDPAADEANGEELDMILFKTEIKEYMVEPRQVTHLEKLGVMVRIWFIGGTHIDVQGNLVDVHQRLKSGS